MTVLRLLAEAEHELRAAARWYEVQRPGLGVEFIGALDAALHRISETPDAYPVWLANQRFQRAIVRRFPYVVFYRLVSEEIVVVAIAHNSRRPGYWLTRVEGSGG